VVEVVGKRKASNTWDLSAYENAPAALANRAPVPDDGAAVAHKANLSRRLALLERSAA
jgi:hypothetical protein